LDARTLSIVEGAMNLRANLRREKQRTKRGGSSTLTSHVCPPVLSSTAAPRRRWRCKMDLTSEVQCSKKEVETMQEEAESREDGGGDGGDLTARRTMRSC
jgi:hypothetical protein